MLPVQGQQTVFEFGHFLLHLNQSHLLLLDALLCVFQNLVCLCLCFPQDIFCLALGFADDAVTQLLRTD